MSDKSLPPLPNRQRFGKIPKRHTWDRLGERRIIYMLWTLAAASLVLATFVWSKLLGWFP